ncbi:MAG: hypothetical protein IJ808_08005 [Muribaculaceae bacterium]|nr:hypothetical protein [Muribaculaceae bacterium]
MMKQTFVVAAVLLGALVAQGFAPDSATVMNRIASQESELRTLQQLAWQNPAVKPLQQSWALSSVGASWQSRDESTAIQAQLGDRATLWAFDADTHMKHNTATLWGHATYNNGRQHHVLWNETSQPELLYPYLLADSVNSARINVERYAFAGGYADFKGRIAWGAHISYEAGLYYRHVDPRPRNVTADLQVVAGIGTPIMGSHLAALALKFRKYKQTNDVAFYSELGSDKLFHLTGLTNDYDRFAGTGSSTYYKGYEWVIEANAQPLAGRGLAFSAQASRFSFDNILTAFNKLPMAHLTHQAVRAEAAWLSEHGWGLQAHSHLSRRVGTENIFGDAAASVYPKIGSLDLYHENRFDVGIEGVWEHAIGRQAGIALHPAVDYHHRNETYNNPQERWLVNDMTLSLRAKGAMPMGRALCNLLVGVAWTAPTQTELTWNGVKTELASLQRLLSRDFYFASHHHTSILVRPSVNLPVGKDFALQAAVMWLHGSYVTGVHADNVNASVAFIF